MRLNFIVSPNDSYNIWDYEYYAFKGALIGGVAAASISCLIYNLYLKHIRNNQRAFFIINLELVKEYMAIGFGLELW